MKMSLICLLAFASVAHASMREPDVEVTLRKIDVKGRESWHRPFSRTQRPYLCEIYEGRVVIYLRSVAELPPALQSRYSVPPQFYTEVVFLDESTGLPLPAFDTRRFNLPSLDPLLAVSPNARSVLDGLILCSRPPGGGGTLIYFDRNSRSVAAILRTDVYYGIPPTVHADDIYCFTQAPFAPAR